MIDWQRPWRMFDVFFTEKRRILIVCRENICRSPMAEGLLREQLAIAGLGKEVEVVSAGTHATQPGRRPDPRAERAAAIAGIDLTKIRARRVTPQDIDESDLVLAMDKSNLNDLMRICPEGQEQKVSLLLSHVPGEQAREVPDPYYGSTEGFETVFELLDTALSASVEGITDAVL
ncbi:MAG: low molecular weight protein-tyrosine-phosphatase [Halioglobus sp.]